MVTINGIDFDVAGKTISEYIALSDFDPRQIAVERNGDIIVKSQYATTILNDGHKLEIVSFVGGGWFYFDISSYITKITAFRRYYSLLSYWIKIKPVWFANKFSIF